LDDLERRTLLHHESCNVAEPVVGEEAADGGPGFSSAGRDVLVDLLALHSDIVHVPFADGSEGMHCCRGAGIQKAELASRAKRIGRGFGQVHCCCCLRIGRVAVGIDH
jgi:hypothetical protein